jgi:hypothetical protein
MWRADSRELYYLALDGMLMAAGVTTTLGVIQNWPAALPD